MENKKVEIGKSRGNQIQGVKAVIEKKTQLPFPFKHIEFQSNSLFESEMKVLSIAILKWKKDTPEPLILCQECELSQFSYFQKNTSLHLIPFHS